MPPEFEPKDLDRSSTSQARRLDSPLARMHYQNLLVSLHNLRSSRLPVSRQKKATAVSVVRQLANLAPRHSPDPPVHPI